MFVVVFLFCEERVIRRDDVVAIGRVKREDSMSTALFRGSRLKLVVRRVRKVEWGKASEIFLKKRK